MTALLADNADPDPGMLADPAPADEDRRPLPASRLRPTDALRAAAIGLRSRKLRSALTALGIAIGIAAMVAVVGISASSRADVLAEIDALGTGLLRAAAGTHGVRRRRDPAGHGPPDGRPHRPGARRVRAHLRRRHGPAQRSGRLVDHRRHRRPGDRPDGPDDDEHGARRRTLPRCRVGRHPRRRARRGRRGPPRHQLARRVATGVDHGRRRERAVVRRHRHPRPVAARARARQRGARRLRRRRHAVGHQHVAEHPVRQHRTGPGRGRARRARRVDRPAVAQRGGGRPTVRRARGPGADRRRPAQPARSRWAPWRCSSAVSASPT